MYRTGGRLNAYDAIASYNKQMGGTLRVAAMSALEYTGFNHYVPIGKPVLTDVVQHLSEDLDNNRVKRKFLYMTEKAGHYWFEELHPEKTDIGTRKIPTAANWTFNRKYNMIIPKDLEEYEG